MKKLILLGSVLVVLCLLVAGAIAITDTNPLDDLLTATPIASTEGGVDGSGKRADFTGAVKSKELTNDDTITFPGWGTYTVSKERPEIELYNPENNKVCFVFSIIDKSTNEVVVKTDSIEPGEYVYLNLYEHFPEVGNYDLTIFIETHTSDGVSTNGVNEAAVLQVI